MHTRCIQFLKEASALKGPRFDNMLKYDKWHAIFFRKKKLEVECLIYCIIRKWYEILAVEKDCEKSSLAYSKSKGPRKI